MQKNSIKPNEAEASLLALCNQGNLEAIEALFADGRSVGTHFLELGLLTSCRDYKVLGEHQEIIQLLINKGASVNVAENSSGLTPLMIACAKGLSHVAEVLLENRADVDRVDASGRSAIFFALESEHGENSELVSLLLEHGCKLNLRNSSGMTPILVAVSRNLEKSALLILKKGVPLDARDAHGNSLLHLAAKNDSDVLTRELLKLGMRNARNVNDEGRTPSVLASDRLLQACNELGVSDAQVK
jgi:ankyrin repeat protein